MPDPIDPTTSGAETGARAADGARAKAGTLHFAAGPPHGAAQRSRGPCGAAQRSRGPLSLPDPATVVVVGGGPAGSFFAIRLLRAARQAGRSIHLVILEKKTEIAFYQPEFTCSWEGCNYCAGGISPRLADILRVEGIELPEEIVESRAVEVVVHGDWKSVRLPVPEGREMLSVFRGSRPRQRAGRYTNFDTVLLQMAIAQGAEVITGEVTRAAYSDEGRPIISYRQGAPKSDTGGETADETIEADFAVFANGVNRAPGMDVAADPLFADLQAMIPGLRPPKVRRALISEMQAQGSADPDVLLAVDGEVHFVQYGSKDLHIEMSSLIPKQNWVTVVVLGKSVDQAQPSEFLGIMQQFVELPHIRRLLPPGVRLRPGCSCHPNMTIGAAKEPFGSRVALTGDMAVSRLYKDGLYSAWTTSAALADCLLEKGVDRDSLRRRYGPVVHAFDKDNRYGRVIFMLSRWVFSHPALSRVLYQAILTERKTTPQEHWRLARILWQIASGDESYRHVLVGMLQPTSVWLIARGGLLTTLRNQATERLFGLDWRGIGRHQTGVSLEDRVRKRHELFSVLGLAAPPRAPEMERVYSIRIRAGEEAIFRQLGKFGDGDREYLWPRFVIVRRTAGAPNQVGTTIRYDVGLFRGGRERGGPASARRSLPPILSFTVRLDEVVPGRYLLYRILDGFGREGIFSFDVQPVKHGVNLLSTYVGFDFPRGRGLLAKAGWRVFKGAFPSFAHDVVWNHSLCKIRYLAEADDHPAS
jgi:flavin-dependent dehydrogenase